VRTKLFESTGQQPYQTRYGLAGKDLPRSLAPTDKKDIGPRSLRLAPFGSN